MRTYSENNKGVHLDSPVGDGRTLCGDVEEGDEPLGIEPANPTSKTTVTCPDCIRIIAYCRGVKTGKAEQEQR